MIRCLLHLKLIACSVDTEQEVVSDPVEHIFKEPVSCKRVQTDLYHSGINYETV